MTLIKTKFSSPGIAVKGCNIFGGQNSKMTVAPVYGTDDIWTETVPLQPHLYRYENAFRFTSLPSPGILGDHIATITNTLNMKYYGALTPGVTPSVPPSSAVDNLTFSFDYGMYYGKTPPYNNNDLLHEDSDPTFTGYMAGGWNFDPLGTPPGITYYRTRMWVEITTLSGTYLDPEELTVLRRMSIMSSTRIPGISGGNYVRNSWQMNLAVPIKDFCRVITQTDYLGTLLNRWESGLNCYALQTFWTSPFTYAFAPRMGGGYDNGEPSIYPAGNLNGYRTADATDNTWVNACPLPES